MVSLLDESEKKIVKSLVKLCDVDPSVSNEKFERTEIENNVEDPKWVLILYLNKNREIENHNINDKFFVKIAQQWGFFYI